jgi:hypothetical protein
VLPPVWLWSAVSGECLKLLSRLIGPMCVPWHSSAMLECVARGRGWSWLVSLVKELLS